MSAEPYRWLHILTEAMKFPDSLLRRRYAESACGDDAALLQQVLRCLAMLDEGFSFDEIKSRYSEAAQSTKTISSPDLPGTVILPEVESVGTILNGKYELLRLLADGGMGSVYLAQQLKPVHHLVAVKLVRSDLNTNAVLDRFEAERRTLELLDHLNIAKVLDAGTSQSGRPYFVMEYVDGVSITTYADRKQLSITQRLELFIPVCQGIQHAHQRGLLHRDIKPSNIMVTEVDGKPLVKIIDFGVAKAVQPLWHDLDHLTQTGAIVGTPEYMSPEQADFYGDSLDTRSDVYSLGVLLYELLTGTTPVDRKSLGKVPVSEILRIVREVDVPLPSSRLSTHQLLDTVAKNRGTDPGRLCRAVRGELDWILLKALEKDRNRRYESPASFARDISRYLNDDLIEARPPSRTYRLKKFLSRNRTTVGFAGMALLLLIMGLIGTTAGMLQAQAAKAELETANKKIINEKARLSEQVEFSRLLLTDVAEQANAIESRQAQGKNTDLQRAYLTKQIAQLIEQYRQAHDSDTKLQELAASMHRYFGNLSRFHDQVQTANNHYERSQQLWAKLCQSDSNNMSYRFQSIATRLDHAILLAIIGKTKEGLALLQDVNQELTEFPDRNEYWRIRAFAQCQNCYVNGLVGETELAIENANLGLQLMNKIDQDSTLPKLPTDHFLLGVIYEFKLRTLEQKRDHAAVLNTSESLLNFLQTMPQNDQNVQHLQFLARLSEASAMSQNSRGFLPSTDRLFADLRAAIAKFGEENPLINQYRLLLIRADHAHAQWLIACSRHQEAKMILEPAHLAARSLVEQNRELIEYRDAWARVCVALATIAKRSGDEQDWKHWQAGSQKIIDNALARCPQHASLRELAIELQNVK